MNQRFYEEVERLINIIETISFKENLSNFEMDNNITQKEKEERAIAIDLLETMYERVPPHHQTHLYIIDNLTPCERGYGIFEYPRIGHVNETGTPVTIGKTPEDALKMAYKWWGIPPVLVCNSKYYCKNIYKIKDMIREL